MGKVIKTVVHTFPASDYLAIENQIIYESWERTEIGQWIKKHSVEELEINEKAAGWAMDMGGAYANAVYISVTATLIEKDYVFYKLKWGK